MLNAMRDGAKSGIMKFFLMGLLVMAAGGLVLTDVGGFFRGGVSATDVAKGKGFTIGAQEFDRTVRRTLAQQGINPQQAYQFGLIDQILTREVQTKIMSLEAQKHGLMIADQDVIEEISEMTETLAQNGGSKKEALQQVLRTQGISESEFVEAIRNEMRNNLFRSALTSGAGYVSDATAQDIYQYDNQTRDIEYFVLTLKSVKDITQPTDIQLSNYYETIKNTFLIAERRSATVATLKPEALEGAIEITDEKLKAAYDEQIDRYKRKELRTVQQAIVNSPDEASKIADIVKSGLSLENAVMKVTGNKNAYLGESEFEESGLLDEIAGPVFNAEKGDTLGPIQTALGQHIITIQSIAPPRTQPFEEVKADLKKEMQQERLMDEMMDAANIIDDRLASGEDLESIVADVGLTTEKFNSFTMGGMGRDNKDAFKGYQGDKAQILEAAFTYDVGESAPVMELADGRFVTVRIDEIEERSYQPLDEVKDKVKAQWIEEQQDAANRLRVSEALNKLRETNDFAAVAKEYGVSIKKQKALKRLDEVKDIKSSTIAKQLFEISQGEYTAAQTTDGQVIATVTAITLPDLDKVKAEDIEAVKTRMEQNGAQEVITQYLESLSRKYEVKVNKRLMDQLYASTPIQN